mgnify:CR=1 FL=1
MEANFIVFHIQTGMFCIIWWLLLKRHSSQWLLSIYAECNRRLVLLTKSSQAASNGEEQSYHHAVHHGHCSEKEADKWSIRAYSRITCQEWGRTCDTLFPWQVQRIFVTDDYMLRMIRYTSLWDREHDRMADHFPHDHTDYSWEDDSYINLGWWAYCHRRFCKYRCLNSYSLQ